MKTECSINVNLTGLTKLIQSFGVKGYVKIGILGDGGARQDGLSNAQIGVIHEFGSPEKNLAQRSFLRMPLQHEGKAIMKDMMGSKDKIMKDMLKGKKDIFFKLLSIRAENAIQDAFDSSGFGSWKAKNKVKNGKSSPLIDTGELRGSVSSQVVSGGK